MDIVPVSGSFWGGHKSGGASTETMNCCDAWSSIPIHRLFIDPTVRSEIWMPSMKRSTSSPETKCFYHVRRGSRSGNRLAVDPRITINRPASLLRMQDGRCKRFRRISRFGQSLSLIFNGLQRSRRLLHASVYPDGSSGVEFDHVHQS